MGILGPQPTPLQVQQQQQAFTTTVYHTATQQITASFPPPGQCVKLVAPPLSKSLPRDGNANDEDQSSSAPASSTSNPAVLTTSTVLHHRATYTVIPLPRANSDGVLVTPSASFDHDPQPVSVLVELAKHWHEHETGQPYSVTRVREAFDRLPANYRVYEKERDDGSGRIDRYIVGHPSSVLGRRHYYRSASAFAKHLINLMADNDMDECECDVCSCSCKKCNE